MPTPQSSQELLLAQADYLHFVSKQNSQNTQLGRTALPTHNNNQEDFEEFEGENYPQNNHSQQKFSNKKSQKLSNNSGMMSLDEFKRINIDTLPFDEVSTDFYDIFSNPAKNFRLMIYGQNGHGKSTFAVNFAGFLSEHFGNTLYCSSEEGISISLQNKLKHIKNKNLFITTCKTAKDLINILKKDTSIQFLFIDSINDMKISLEDLKQIIDLNPQRAVIYIMQATKSGEFKGGNEFAHEGDIRIKVEDFEPHTEKNRYR